MSRHLPEHPNLEHLRKQAKDRLHELQQQNPETQLAEAQHAIAREYGFASWPKLRVYLDSLSLARPANPFVGRWTANLAKSSRHPSNQFQSATLEFAVAGEVVTITDLVVDESGRQERTVNIVHADGKEHASENGSGYVLIANWRGAHVLETMATKDGEVVGSGSYEVSPDGQTMTITGDQQVIVLDKRTQA